MRTRWIFLLLLSWAIPASIGAQHKLLLQVEGMRTNKAYLYAYVGNDASQMVDSATQIIGGKIGFNFPTNSQTGMYRLVMGPQNYLDFVYNQEDIELRTHFSAPLDSLVVIKSQENKLWKQYTGFYMQLNRKREFLLRLSGLYQPTEPFYQEIQKELAGIQQTDPESISKQIIASHPRSYVARFLKTELSPIVPVGLGMDEELAYLMEHFFDQVDFEDEDLRFSPPLMARIQSYFGLHQQAFPPQELENKMIEGVNRLVSLAAINDVMYAFVLDELTKMFERSEFETLFAYLTETFLLDGSCKDESRQLELEEALIAIKKTAIGTQVPEIVLPLATGPVVLSQMQNKPILLVFWASWCPNCEELMPGLKQIYQQYKTKGFEIIAISLDKEKSAYEAALAKGQYPWINYSELKGWDCSIAYDYGIRATPTMILLNQNREVLAKPTNLILLRSQLEKL